MGAPTDLDDPVAFRRWYESHLAQRAVKPLPPALQDAIADGLPIDRVDGSARDLSETEALAAWRSGHALRVRQ